MVVVLCCVIAAGCGASSWDKAVDEANDEGKPLVIEFYASWCTPCKWFEARVLPRPAVAKALDGVVFRRLDFDSTEGKHHARRLGVNGVPTFVAVDESGQVIGGLRGAAGESRFLQFLRWVRHQQTIGAR